jgi:hypothetical protein
MTIEVAQKTYRYHAAILDGSDLPLRTCGHDHGIVVAAAMDCALRLGWNGAVEVRLEDGVRTATSERWRVWKDAGKKMSRAL